MSNEKDIKNNEVFEEENNIDEKSTEKNSRDNVDENYEENVSELEDDSDDNELKDELEETKDRLIRLQADFSNFKKRKEKEKEGLLDLGKEVVIEDLLPIIDNFERALESSEEKDKFYEGVVMIKDQLIDVLKKNGVNLIEAMNKEFDPNYHYAVQMKETDEYDENFVIEVVQNGYTLNDKVIRPAMVIVSK